MAKLQYGELWKNNEWISLSLSVFDRQLEGE